MPCSYNYLGFAAHDEYCTPRVKECLQRHGWSMCSPRGQAGGQALQPCRQAPSSQGLRHSLGVAG